MAAPRDAVGGLLNYELPAPPPGRAGGVRIAPIVDPQAAGVGGARLRAVPSQVRSRGHVSLPAAGPRPPCPPPPPAAPSRLLPPPELRLTRAGAGRAVERSCGAAAEVPRRRPGPDGRARGAAGAPGPWRPWGRGAAAVERGGD